MAAMAVTNQPDLSLEIDDGLFQYGACPLCGSVRNHPRYPIDRGYAAHLSNYDLSRHELGVSACEQCRHQFVQPIPTVKFLTAYYASYMVEAKTHFYRDRIQAVIPQRFQIAYGKRLAHIKRALGRTGSLLDVGCGLGMFLRLAQEEGFFVKGVEMNEESAERLRKDEGIEVANCLFERYETADTFDVITMWDLLEHLADPLTALRKAYALLRPGGILVVETPARDSVAHWMAKLLYYLSFKLVKSPLNLIYGVHHLQYFSRRSLRKAIQASGFDVVRVLGDATDVQALHRSDERFFVGLLKMCCYRIVFALGKLLAKNNKQIVIGVRRL